MKNRKRLLVQVGLLLAVFFALIILAVGFVVYIASTTMFLNAKNEMIDRDLKRVRDFIQDIPGVSVLIDYWHDHPEDTMRELTTEEMERGYTVYDEKGYWYEALERVKFSEMDEYQKYAIAHDFYAYFAGRINNEQESFGYDAIYCLDVRPGKTGFIYCLGDGENVYSYNTLGGTIDMDISRHRAVQKIQSGNNKETEYEIVDNYNGKSVYIGYAPVVTNGETKCVICIFYDWSSVHKSLNESLILMAVIGLVIMLTAFLLLLHYLRTISVKPVTQIQRSVREYIENKDSSAIAEKMKMVRSGNEFGVLADDISALALEMDRYNKENVRLAGEHERVAAELDLATKIQFGSLPCNFPAFPERSEFDLYASMTPAKEVGGDFYDFFMTDDDHLVLLIADVSGKGVPAALFMMSAKILISDRALTGGTPAEILAFVNERICADNKVDMFVTVWLGILEISTGKLTCANAGHEYPVLMRSGKFEVFKDKHGFVIGGMAGVKYSEYELTLNEGDAIFVYTDGVAEATDNDTDLYGTKRLVEALNKEPSVSPDKLIGNVKRSIDEFVQDSPQFDDITMLCLKYNGKDNDKRKQEA